MSVFDTLAEQVAVEHILATNGGAKVRCVAPTHRDTNPSMRLYGDHVHCFSCPRISEGFLEEERRALPGWVFRQEYECSFEETEDQVFSTEMVERAVTSEVRPLFGGG